MNRSVVDHLNAELATAFVLALNTKRYHWTVTGPHFRDYHLRFEDLYTAADGTVDELAERIRMLGGVPLHAPAQIEAQTKADISSPTARLPASASSLSACPVPGPISNTRSPGCGLSSCKPARVKRRSPPACARAPWANISARSTSSAKASSFGVPSKLTGCSPPSSCGDLPEPARQPWQW